MKIFLLRLFKMVANQTVYSKFEQRSVIKILMAEKWAKHRFATASLSWKDNGNTLTLVRKSSKCSSQERRSCWLYSWTWEKLSLNFFEEVSTVNSAPYCELLRQNSPYLLICWIIFTHTHTHTHTRTHIYIYDYCVWIYVYINVLTQQLYIFIHIVVGGCSWERPEGSFFISYYTEKL